MKVRAIDMDEMKKVAELIDELAELVAKQYPGASNFSIYADAEGGKYFRFDVTQYGDDENGHRKHRELADVTRFSDGHIQEDVSEGYNSRLSEDELLEVAE